MNYYDGPNSIQKYILDKGFKVPYFSMINKFTKNVDDSYTASYLRETNLLDYTNLVIFHHLSLHELMKVCIEATSNLLVNSIAKDIGKGLNIFNRYSLGTFSIDIADGMEIVRMSLNEMDKFSDLCNISLLFIIARKGANYKNFNLAISDLITARFIRGLKTIVLYEGTQKEFSDDGFKVKDFEVINSSKQTSQNHTTYKTETIDFDNTMTLDDVLGGM